MNSATTPYDHLISTGLMTAGGALVSNHILTAPAESQLVAAIVAIAGVVWTALNLSAKIPSPVAALLTRADKAAS